MQKKLTVFLFLILMFLFSAKIYAASSVPEIYINGEKQNNSYSFVIHSDTVYILPETAKQIFSLNLSTDEYNVVYTFSTPVRTVTYDSKSGSVNVGDRHSFAHNVIENAYPSYDYNSKTYIPLRMLCNSLGINIEYNASTHSVHIDYPNYFVGLFTSEGVAVASKGSKFGLVNSGGNVLLAFDYNYISNYDNPSLFKVVKDHRSGLASSKGKLVTDIIYNEINYISPAEIYLHIDDEMGMCDIDGKIIIPVKYDDIAYSGNMIAMVKTGFQWYLLNCVTNTLSETQYNEVYEITVGIQTDNNMIKGYYAKKNGKWGCIDSFGNTVIEFRYEALDKFDERGRARVIYNGKFGIVDCGGKTIIPTGYDYIYPFGNLRIAVAKLGSRYGAVNLDGTVAIPFEYDYIYSFNNNPVTVAYKDGVFTLLSTQGTCVTNKTYSYIEEFKNGIALAFRQGYGYIDHNGNEVIECIHTDVKQGTAISVFLKKDGKWALFSPNGENMTGYIYDDAGEFENGLSAVSIAINGSTKYGYVNDSGDIIIPFIYSSAQKFKYGRAVVSVGRKHGIIDFEGNTVIPFDYTGFNPSYDYNVIAAANTNSKWGLISFANKALTPFVYDYIFEFNNGLAAVLQNGKFGVIDTLGNIVVPITYKSADKALESYLN